MHKGKTTISIVSPFYNEEELVSAFLKEITSVLSDVGMPFEIICVNDGSKDGTLEKLIEAKKIFSNIKIINLSRNFGKESALTAGLDFSRGEIIIPIDSDLQHPPKLIHSFISEWKKGYDVVLAKRTNINYDSFLKKSASGLYYKFHNKISHTELPEGVGDYRLITKKVLKAIQLLPENQRFMKGIFAWVGFKTTIVEYECIPRKSGKTKYNGWKLWNFALDGITGFSTAPLRTWLYLGMSISLLSFAYGTYIVLKTLIIGVDLPGYASLFTSILFFSGIQLIGIGILGEYIGRIYLESKRRPQYIVENEY